MWKCKYCKNSFDFERTTEKANHSKYCLDNPKSFIIKQKAKERMEELTDTKYGTIKEFDVNCFVCNEKFKVSERTNIFPSKDKYYCSRKCANSIGGKQKARIYHPDDDVSYRALCLRYHKKECIICKESNVIEVHHLNHNHNDNRKENLVVLCPTHHRYIHSKYKYLIEDKITEYVKQKWG